MKRLLILDTSALFFRSHSALSRAMGEMTTSYGLPVTGTYGVLNSLFSVLEKTDYDCIIPCAEGGSNWRKRESEEYKGNREKRESSFYADLDLLLSDVLPALGMNVCRAPGYEADDVIATISRNSPAYGEIHVLSCDRDLLQLITNKVKVLLFNSAKKIELADIDWVLDKEGVYPSEVKYKKSLCGDKSDNVAGIKGIGNKTAVKIIQECRPTEINPEFTGADKICLHPKVANEAGTFLANLRLVSLDQDVPDLTWFASSPPAPGSLLSCFEQLEFRSLLKPARLAKIRMALRVTEAKS